jgi:hypothetical protein
VKTHGFACNPYLLSRAAQDKRNHIILVNKKKVSFMYFTQNRARAAEVFREKEKSRFVDSGLRL